MNTPDFLDILQKPTHLKNEQIFEIEDVVKNFPFFQAARVLHLKALKNQNSFRYNQNLKTTAAHTTDRSVLFHFITSDTFHNIELSEEESTIIEEIETIDKNVLTNINKDEISELEETDKANDENIFDLNIDIKPSEIEYIEEIRLENLQKEVAETTHDDEVKLLKEKVEKESENITNVNPTFKYAKSLQNKGLIFEINREENIETVTDIFLVKQEKETSQNDEYIPKFEVINEEIEPKSSEKETIQEENFEIVADVEKPIHFNANDTHSFGEWLQLSTLKPIDRSSDKVKTNSQDKKMALIDMFIEKNPKIKPSKITGFTVNFDQVEKIENDVVMTETLAKVYIEQKKYQSAIKAYEILSLKFPEKSSSFADQIKMLEELKHN